MPTNFSDSSFEEEPYYLEKEIQNFSLDSVKVTPEDKRQAFKNYVAGVLALILWLSLSGVIVWHMVSINSVVNTYQGASSENITTEESKLNVTSSLINDTAKTIYSFLGTLTAAVSAFYFTSLSSSSSNND